MEQNGEGLYDDIPYCGIKAVPKGRQLATAEECAELGKVSLYGLHKINPAVLAETITKEQKKKMNAKKMRLYWRAKHLKELHDAEKDDDKAEKIREKYKNTVVEYKKIRDEIDALDLSIHAVLIPKSWTKAKAEEWAKDHNYSIDKYRTQAKFHRFTQEPKEKYDNTTFITKHPDEYPEIDIIYGKQA